MKALGKLKKEPGLWLYEAPMPVCGDFDLLVKVKKTAICGTDLHIYKWDAWAQATIPVPMTTGHEFVGVVTQVGKDVKGFKIGDRISGEGHLVCGLCRNCRAGFRHLCSNTIGIGVNTTGCFAEYIALPASNAVHVPDYVSDDVASFLDPLGNAAHTALSFDLVGEDVLVTGAGPIGILGALIAQHVGACKVVITDISDYRLSLARQLGIKHAVNVQKTDLRDEMKKLGIKEGFTVGLEMSGSGLAFNQMIHAMNHGGKIAILGIIPDGVSIPWTYAIFHSLTFKCIYGREMYETWYKTIAMLGSGLDVSKIVTHPLHYTEFEKGFNAIIRGECGKVVLDWSHT